MTKERNMRKERKREKEEKEGKTGKKERQERRGTDYYTNQASRSPGANLGLHIDEGRKRKREDEDAMKRGAGSTEVRREGGMLRRSSWCTRARADSLRSHKTLHLLPVRLLVN
jgi:hypothetical protein